MAIVIGADAAGLRWKEVVKRLLGKKTSVVDVATEEGQDFVDVTLAVAQGESEERKTLR